MKKLTQEEVIKRFISTHGNKYDYSKTKFINSYTPVIVTCKIHGDFKANVSWHSKGIGCPSCSGKKKKTTESFIHEAQSVHGDKYDYSKVIYKNNKTPVTIICEKGHENDVLPQNHLRGFGCNTCNGTQKLSQDNFIEKANLIHKNKYDYTKTVYGGGKNSIIIICPVHGEFTQQASAHLSGQGCPKCYGHNKTTTDFINESLIIHGDKYEYSKSEYINSKTDVIIICKVHGDFNQTPNAHLRGTGCPTCSGNIKLTTDSFIEKAKIVHGDKYEYSKTVYGSSNKDSLIITCKDHGDFNQRAFDHLQGCGCPNCNNYGKLEQELRDYIESLGIITTKDRTVLEGKEIDIFIPEYNIGFEFNGLFWHSEKRAKDPINAHSNKTNLAKNKDIRLIHIYEDDWIIKKDIVKSIIRNSLGLENTKVYARNCSISFIEHRLASDFMDKNHILGAAKGVNTSLALIYENKIVSVMQFSKSASHRGKSSEHEYELIRFANSIKVIGGASKLFSHFVKNYSPKIVTSYSDKDMFDGGVYKILGFNHISDVPPDYKIIDGNIRRHKSNFRKSELAKRFPEKYNPDLTERENCWNMGLYRIYNSGLKKWVWNSPDVK